MDRTRDLILEIVGKNADAMLAKMPTLDVLALGRACRGLRRATLEGRMPEMTDWAWRVAYFIKKYS